MKLKYFNDEYDKSEFYSLMGKYFAERKYRNMFPYLVNEEDSNWIVALEDEEVVGFTVYEEKKNKIIFDYTFGETNKIELKLLKERFKAIENINKPIELDITKDNDITYWLDKGFEIKKETKNYYFLRKDIVKNDK